MLLFINLNTNVMLVTPRSKGSLDFLNNFNFNFKSGKIWVVDDGYLWFIEMFLFCHSDLNIQHYFLRFFGVNWSAGAPFALSESFNCSNSSLSWGMISLCIVITLGQSITDRNLHKINYTDNRTIVWVFLLVLILNLFITKQT